LAAIDRAVRARGQRAQLIDELERSGLRMRPEEWAAVQIAVVVTMAAALGFLVGSVLAVPPGGLVGWIGCRMFVAYKIKKRAAAFEAALPDALQLVAGALRSGFALNQSITAVVREGVEPIAGEFGRALQEVRLGAELVDALDATAKRMNSYDLELVVMCIRTSREVGGNLAEALETTVHTMRERVQLKGQVRVLSAEGRLAAKVLIALPILMALYFYAVRRDYVRVLYTTGTGIVIAIVGVVLLSVGAFWLSRLTKIEV
jgi:tight adherence protein B